jgi:hypothetical protein
MKLKLATVIVKSTSTRIFGSQRNHIWHGTKRAVFVKWLLS